MIAGLRTVRLGWHGIDRRIAARASHGGKSTVFVHELFWFGVKQAWACLFGALMLALLVATWMFWPADAPLGRYDFVTLMAVAIQTALLATGLETRREALVIVLFHVTGTLMEIFKTATGSWVYPGASILHAGGVPLFTGFMYASVGSYIVRAWRLFEFRFTGHPGWSRTALLAVAIYLNFFSDHYGFDLRWLLFVAVAWMFGPCRCTTGCEGNIAGCRCCWDSCWSRCSSGSPRTSALSPAHGCTPRSIARGTWCRRRRSARGCC